MTGNSAAEGADRDSANTTRPVSDEVTTLAKVNENPPAPEDVAAAADEKEDTVTVLARVNDAPPD
jgi:hypothetical protein